MDVVNQSFAVLKLGLSRTDGVAKLALDDEIDSFSLPALPKQLI